MFWWIQDVISYAQEVNDPVQAFLNLKVSYGSAKIIKTSEDGKVDNLTFTVTGNGVNQTVKTNAKGEIQIDNLMPGVYTVTAMDYDKYEPQCDGRFRSGFHCDLQQQAQAWRFADREVLGG